MNRRTINAVLSKRMKDWISSIEDKDLQVLVERDLIVTGGAIASLLMHEEPKDYDVYFKTEETTLAVTQYYVKQFNEAHPKTNAVVEQTAGRVLIKIKSKGVASEDNSVLENSFEDVYNTDVTKKEGSKYRPVFLTSNAITLSDQIQLVIRFFGEPSEIHTNYDFVHCTNYWTFKDKVVLHPDAVECILNKELVYQGSRYPLCSVIRTRKFINRGFTINAGQYLKMMMQISEMDLSDIEVLEDQLIGVDSAYFNILINAMKSKQAGDASFKITPDYLSNLIDKLF